VLQSFVVNRERPGNGQGMAREWPMNGHSLTIFWTFFVHSPAFLWPFSPLAEIGKEDK